MPQYKSKDVLVNVQVAGHGGKIVNSGIANEENWRGAKFPDFQEGDFVVTFADGASFPIHPEFGKRILERVEEINKN
jgi:hypothetical protein